jgi:CheY-like chemotaxis protein
MRGDDMSKAVVAIIEDDHATREFIRECLADEGYGTLTYDQGAGAYEFIEHKRPDVVILDIRMEHPRAGLAVLQHLRRDPETVSIPVLVCTADAPFTREWSKALDEFRCAILSKPFLIEDLLDAVARLIQPPPSAPHGRPREEIAAIRPVIGLVDTDGRGIATYTEQLERKGYKVVGSRWGSGLRDMAVREQPDLLIVDIGDRRQSLLSHVLRRLRRDPLTSQIPLLVNPQHGRDLYRTIEEIVGPPPLGLSSPQSRRV